LNLVGVPYDAAALTAPVIAFLERSLQVTLAQSVDPKAGAGHGAGGLRNSPDATPRPPQSRHNVGAIAVMFAVGVVVVILRRRDAVTYPQFWAEDGVVWFTDAYNGGVASIIRSYSGYLVTLPRLVAIPSVYLSLQQAALLFNLVAVAAQVAPAAFFMSRRFEHVAPRLWVRATVAIAYLLIPSFELDATLTNSLWHLAILAIMVVVARPPTAAVSRVFDVTVLVLAGLTGPFAVLLAPAAFVRVLVSRVARRWYIAMTGALVATLAVQGWVVVHTHRALATSLGAGWNNLLFLISDRVVLPGSFAEEAHTRVYASGQAHGAILAGLITLFAAGVVAFVLLKSDWFIRIFVVFCFGIMAMSLLFPIATGPTTDPWTHLATTGDGDRYFFCAEVAWLACVIWASSRLRSPTVRWLSSAVMTALFLSGLISYSHYPAFIDEHPAAFDAQLHAAPPGTIVVIPVNPGGPWAMHLIRR
jgi:hypothetical protein